MSKILVAVLALTFLAGCGGVKERLVTKTEHRVVMPPESMFDCPQTELPDPDSLTQRRIAGLITQFYEDNRKCGASLEEIKRFLEDARDTVEAENE